MRISFIQWEILWLQAQKTTYQPTLRELFQGYEGRNKVIIEVLQQRQVLNIKRLLLMKGNQISHVKEFSIFLCMERFKHLSSLKSLLSQVSQLSGDSILCFSTSWASLGLTIGSDCRPDVCELVGILLLPECPFSSVQSFSRVQLFVTPWTAARQASLSITNSQNPPKPMSIELVMPSSHLILHHPLFLLPSIFPSIRVFSNESALHMRWPKYWSFSFTITPSNDHPMISFKMGWLDLLAVPGTLKSLLQHRSSKASILQHSASL